MMNALKVHKTLSSNPWMLIEIFVGAKWGGSRGEMRKRRVYENNESNLAVQQSTSSHMKPAFFSNTSRVFWRKLCGYFAAQITSLKIKNASRNISDVTSRRSVRKKSRVDAFYASQGYSIRELCNGKSWTGFLFLLFYVYMVSMIT